MGCLITSGRTEPCKDNLGGVKAVWLANFTHYNFSEFTFATGGAELTAITPTEVYKFPSRGDSTTFSETKNEDSYSQSLTLAFTNISMEDRATLSLLIKLEYRAIVEMNNGKFLVMGLENGVEVNSIDGGTGNGLGAFNGFTLSFSANELRKAPFMDNLRDAGFIPETEFKEYRFQDFIDFLFQDNELYEFQ